MINATLCSAFRLARSARGCCRSLAGRSRHPPSARLPRASTPLSPLSIAGPLQNRYKVLMLDSGAGEEDMCQGGQTPGSGGLGAVAGCRKEIIDFRLARSEFAAEWQHFLDEPYRRGLTGGALDMICTDGWQGLLAALPIDFHRVPVQRCLAHTIRNILDKIRVADQPAVKRALHKVTNAENLPEPKRHRQNLHRGDDRRLPRRQPLSRAGRPHHRPRAETADRPPRSNAARETRQARLPDPRRHRLRPQGSRQDDVLFEHIFWLY